MYGLFRGSSYKPSTVGPTNVIPNPTPTQSTHQRTRAPDVATGTHHTLCPLCLLAAAPV